MKRKVVQIGLALVLLGFFMVPQQGYGESPKRLKTRLGIGFSTAYVPDYVAKEKGFFEEENLDVEFVTIEIVPDMVQSIIGGSTDAGVGGSFGMVAAIAKGAPVQAVSFYCYGGERIALAVRKDSGIKSLKDLYEKKVGVQTGTIGHQMFINMCKVEGLDISKIDVTPLKNVDMPAAIATKGVDAIVTWEPNPSILEEKGLVDVIQRGGKYQKTYGCLFFGAAFIEKNREVVRRFIKAHFKGMQFVRQNPREASVINSKYVRGSKPEEIEKTYRYMIFDPRVNEAAFEGLEADMRFMVDQKIIPSMIDPKRIANREFSDEIVKKFPELVKDLK